MRKVLCQSFSVRCLDIMHMNENVRWCSFKMWVTDLWRRAEMHPSDSLGARGGTMATSVALSPLVWLLALCEKSQSCVGFWANSKTASGNPRGQALSTGLTSSWRAAAITFSAFILNSERSGFRWTCLRLVHGSFTPMCSFFYSGSCQLLQSSSVSPWQRRQCLCIS